ncbi:uncharacterized protein [Dermacentor albipictus]|uniref:uncharacterized protein isoform X1 n=1 Tax=Dermacentor albipictus TaxID=60249 RepID=UPI0038FD1B36
MEGSTLQITSHARWSNMVNEKSAWSVMDAARTTFPPSATTPRRASGSRGGGGSSFIRRRGCCNLLGLPRSTFENSAPHARSAISQERQRRSSWIGVRTYPAQHPHSRLVNQPTAYFPAWKQLFGTASILHLTAQLFGTASILHLTAMDEQQVDAADIEEGLLRLLGRCIHKINRARRQEKRLNIYTHAQKEPPEKVKKEVRDRRAELRSSIDAVMNYEEGAAVAQDAAPAPDSSGEDDNAQIHPSLATRLEEAHAALGAWRSANRVARQSGKLADIAVLAIRKAAGRQKVQELQTAVQGLHDL